MRTLQEKYNSVLEGNFSKAQFVKDASMQLPNLVSRVNSFEDTAAILKNRGMIAEAKMQEPKYSTAKPEDAIAPDVIDTGIKFELDKKYGTLDVTPEQYEQCKAMVVKNLSKDLLYYVKQDSIQLETPAEKMEKVTLKEEVDPKATVAKMIPILQDYLANGGDRGAARDIMDDLKNGRNLHVYADIESVEDLKDQLDYEYSYSDDLSDLGDEDEESFERLDEGVIDTIKDKLVAAGSKISKMFSPEETAKMKDAVEKALGKPASEIGLSDLTLANAKKVGPLVKDFLLKEEQSLNEERAEGYERYNTRWDDEDWRIETRNWEAWLEKLQSMTPSEAQATYDALTPEEKEYIIASYERAGDVKDAGVHDAIHAWSAKRDKKSAKKSLTGKLGAVLSVLGLGTAAVAGTAALISSGAMIATLGGLVALIVGGVMIAQGPNDPLPNDSDISVAEAEEETLRRERGLEEQQLKELFKKIIAKVITE